jgi:soluble lytic murein transglycosylase-like protein
MKRLLTPLWLGLVAAVAGSSLAHAGHGQLDALIKAQAKANAVPEVLAHRVILRESRYQPELIGRGGCIGLMQIKLGTARGLGYHGDEKGLRDPNTNLTYGMKYLGGAYRAANGDHDRAMRLYASGYYDIAKRQRQELAAGRVLESSGNPQPPPGTTAPRELAEKPADQADTAEQADDK